MGKAIWAIIFILGIGYGALHFSKLELPAPVDFSLADGGSVSGILIGKSPQELIIEDSKTSLRQTIEKDDLALQHQLLLWRFPNVAAPGLSFPVSRTITNQTGKAFDAMVTAKKGDMVTVTRNSDKKEFLLNINTLSDEDRQFLSALPNSNAGDVQKWASLQGRHAVWHRHIHNAILEGEKTGLPILLIFRRSEGDISSEMDKNVFRTEKFRNWADRNVVLCLYYNNPDRNYEESGLNGLGSKEGRELADRYGVSTSPVAVVLSPSGELQSKVQGYGGESATSYINRLDKSVN